MKLTLIKFIAFNLFLSLSHNIVAETYLAINNDKTSQKLMFCGLKNTSNNLILSLELSEKDKACLFDNNKNNGIIDIVKDSQIGLDTDNRKENFSDSRVFLLAKEEFGIPEFLEKYPTFDGRGVIAGVIDDGISPLHEGFKKTSDNKRKYIKHFSNSSAYTFNFSENENVEINLNNSPVKPLAIVEFDEKKFSWDYNLNDSKEDKFQFAVVKIDEEIFLCLDQDLDQKYHRSECQRSFNETGDYGFWDVDKKIALICEIDLEKKTLTVNEGEFNDDSHGEGVASVLGAHKISNKYNGVAPGVQIVDYDLSEWSNKTEETAYTIGKFLKAIEKLAQNGAEVINISYSLYFYSAKSQVLMSKAIEKLMDKYKTIVVFSAGNNGPGLGSMNRSLIYPTDSLVAGAYISKKMDELVHGTSGLPNEGQLIYYSSRGPGADFSKGPSVISPLASVTHSDDSSPAMSFSGTSSAAPALAGLASVLISAVKQEGLDVDISVISSAIKLSSKRLTNVPYVFQGHGLPNIQRAFNIYRDILKNKVPKHVKLKTSKINSNDNVSATGIYKNSLTVSGKEEIRVKLTGKFYNNKSEDHSNQKINLLKINYTSPWITGPDQTWVTQNGGANVSFTINYDLIEKTKQENFAEIQFIDSETNLLLAVFPVSVIRPYNSNAKKHNIEISPESAKRIHFHVDSKTNGLEFIFDLSESLGERISLRFYNKNGVIIDKGVVNGGEYKKFIFETIEEGHYQLGISRYRGNENVQFQLTSRPISLKLKSKHFDFENAKKVFEIKNLTPHNLKGDIYIEPKLKPLISSFTNLKGKEKIKFNYQTSELGSYSIKLSPSNIYDLTYPTYRCYQSLNNDNSFSRTLEVETEDQLNQSVSVECYIFDHLTTNDFNHIFNYEVYLQSNEYESFLSIPYQFSSYETLLNTVEFEDLKRGQYNVYFGESSRDRVFIGEVTIF